MLRACNKLGTHVHNNDMCIGTFIVDASTVGNDADSSFLVIAPDDDHGNSSI